MKPISIMRVLLQALFIVFVAGAVFPAYADIALNSSNWEGTDGRHYWQIWTPGNYYLDVQGGTFHTTNYFAIRIRAHNVILDGRGKTITGSGPPASFYPPESDVCGVWVNGGPEMQNVQIKNLNVEKKYFGIWFEWINGGRVENCNTSGNNDGIYLWAARNTTLTRNSANNNLDNGIVLDGADSPAIDCINRDNTLSNNIANGNGLTGIILHLECVNNTLIGNTANDNNHGISLRGVETRPDELSPTNNTLSGNTTNNNPIGIYLGYNANDNVIKGNTMSQNQDKGIWLYSANNTTIYNNYFNNADKNAAFDGSNTGNQWNIDRTEGQNIVGGPYLGGNFWAKPDGKGFSQKTADSNGDGICDSAYNLPGGDGDVDQLPLHAYTGTITTPTVTTSSVSSITCDSALSGGDVTANGGASVTARGVCWSTSQNPTTSGNHTVDGTGTGAFQSSITGLNPGAAYHLRAYATNSAGTGYGADLPFTTTAFEGVIYVNPNDETCGDHCPCYASIQAAINAPYAAHTLKIAQGVYNEIFSLNESRDITVEGGWNASFTEQIPNTTIIKSPTVNSGSMTFRNFIIRP